MQICRCKNAMFRFSLLIHIDKLSTCLVAEENLAVAREIPKPGGD
jgi:hypothetical protein